MPPPPPPRPVLEVKHLRFAYPDGPLALEDVSVEVYAGEMLAIVGPNGAGKSTLLLHFNGLLAGEGEVLAQGEPITKHNLREIRRRVGLVFQDPDDQLFMPRVFDDIAFGLIQLGLPNDEIKEKVMGIIRDLGLEGLENRSSFRLSPGEKKKVALASVLVLEPEILVLDEPSSGLDPWSRRALIRLLASLEQTKIIATHDLDFAAELASRVILLDKGKLVASGPPEVILGDKELLEAHRLEPPSSLVQHRHSS